MAKILTLSNAAIVYNGSVVLAEDPVCTLESRAITLSANGLTNISPSGSYDGFATVAITVAIPTYSGSYSVS